MCRHTIAHKHTQCLTDMPFLSAANDCHLVPYACSRCSAHVARCANKPHPQVGCTCSNACSVSSTNATTHSMCRPVITTHLYLDTTAAEISTQCSQHRTLSLQSLTLHPDGESLLSILLPPTLRLVSRAEGHSAEHLIEPCQLRLRTASPAEPIDLHKRYSDGQQDTSSLCSYKF